MYRSLRQLVFVAFAGFNLASCFWRNLEGGHAIGAWWSGLSSGLAVASPMGTGGGFDPLGTDRAPVSRSLVVASHPDPISDWKRHWCMRLRQTTGLQFLLNLTIGIGFAYSRNRTSIMVKGKGREVTREAVERLSLPRRTESRYNSEF